jgi:diguanylate cyclase (GGDEF)-like protein/PAS domain S-box-containing protein
MTKASLKTVLLVEDNLGDARLLREMLNEDRSLGIKLNHVGRLSEAEGHLSLHPVDIILLDLGLPDAQGLEAVRRAHAAAPHVPLVVLTGMDDEALGAQALQEGAEDYLIKGQVETRGLLRALRYAIERKVMEAAVFAEKERAEVTLKSIGEAVICVDLAGNITFLNVVAENTTGWTQQEAAGRPIVEVLRILEAPRYEIIPYRMNEAAEDDRSGYLPPSCTLIRRDGLNVPIEDCASPIHDRQGQLAGVVVVFRDVSAARAMARQMVYSAEHDFLTGLPNRILLSDRISQAIALAQRHKKKVAVLFLDLDGFKHINDSLGHPIGDKLLQSIAQRLVNCVRGSDTVSRQGGDEFVVLLSEVEEAEDASVAVKRIVRAVVGTHSIDQHDLQVHAAIAAQRMLHTVAAPHSIDRHDLYVTTRIGVSVYPDDGLDAETLIKNADIAMYQAKENGRQTYRFFKPEMNVRAVQRQSIEEDLRRALERHEFALHYQPKIDLTSNAISGVEALIRWTNPTRGAVAPADFIPVAEDCGLILPIGSWVLREACEQARVWLDAGLSVPKMAVNVSAIEFRAENFLENLFAILGETGLSPRALEVEVTESVLMRHAESAASTLRSLRERGVQVAIDDFGTGYSSLSYLRNFPVDTLKIDQSFVRQISAAGEDTAIVTAVISMARSLRLKVVAEGVETLEELAFLRENRCDEAQGYYFSRPIAAEQFAELLRTGIRELPIVSHTPLAAEVVALIGDVPAQRPLAVPYVTP